MPIITTNNIDIYYEQHGKGDDLVLIGGLSSDHNVWKTTLRIFAKHFRVLIFDNRGAGQSSAPDIPYTSELMAQDTVALMTALGINHAYIVGHSMGGCIAQQIAINYPDHLNKLVVACSRSKPSALANMALGMREKLETAGVDKTLLAEYPMPFLFTEAFLKNNSTVKGFIQWTLNNPYPQSLIGYKNQLNAVQTHDVSASISQLTANTLVVAGESDCLMPAKNAAEFAAQLPHAKYIVIPNCAHMPHVEQSQHFAQVVLDFIGKHD